MKILIALSAALLATSASAQMAPPNPGSHQERMEHRQVTRHQHNTVRGDPGGHSKWHKRKVCRSTWRHHQRVKVCRWVRR